MSDYWSGFFSGTLITVFVMLGLNWFRLLIKGYIRDIQAADKPQTVSQNTTKTPNQVVDAAGSARVKLWVLYAFFCFLLFGLLEIVRPGTLRDVLTILGW